MSYRKIFATKWNEFFFAEMNPKALSRHRTLFYTATLVALLIFPMGPMQYESLFQRETYLFRVLHLPVFDNAGVAYLGFLWLLFLVLSAAGILPRISCLFSFLLCLYIAAIRTNIGRYFHSDVVMVQSLLIMAAAAFNRRYCWPILLLRLSWVHFFFSAAILKLAIGKTRWLVDNVTLVTLLNSPYRQLPTHRWAAPMLDFLVARPALCRGLTLGSLSLELLMPLALFSRRMRFILVPAAFSMVFMAWVTFGFPFLFYLFPMSLAWWIPIPPRAAPAD